MMFFRLHEAHHVGDISGNVPNHGSSLLFGVLGFVILIYM